MVEAPVPSQITDPAWPEDAAARQLSGGHTDHGPAASQQAQPGAGAGTSPGPHLRAAGWRELHNRTTEGEAAPWAQGPPAPAPPPPHTAVVPDVLPLRAQHPRHAAQLRHWGPAHPPHPQTALRLPPAPSQLAKPPSLPHRQAGASTSSKKRPLCLPPAKPTPKPGA